MSNKRNSRGSSSSIIPAVHQRMDLCDQDGVWTVGEISHILALSEQNDEEDAGTAKSSSSSSDNNNAIVEVSYIGWGEEWKAYR